MQTFIFLKALYIFLALIFFGVASAFALAFPEIYRYSYAVAILVHSLIMLFIFIQHVKTPKKSDAKKSNS